VKANTVVTQPASTQSLPTPAEATTHADNSHASLDRYIDRFLAAQGWRVTEVVEQKDATGAARFDVTLTKSAEPNMGQSVTRSSSSSGEATFMACSSARLLAV
jgi:hypothetical protein